MEASLLEEVIAINDSSDDDEGLNRTASGQSKTERVEPPVGVDSSASVAPPPSVNSCGKRPSGVDAASWALIQKLQQADAVDVADDDDDEVQIIQPPVATAAAVERRPQRKRRKPSAASNSSSLGCEARQLQQSIKNDEKQQNDLLIASLLQVEEDSIITTPKEEALKPCQRQAVEYVKRKAQQMHEKCLKQLENRVSDLGYTLEDLKQCLDYIRDDAPIVIHLKEATLAQLIKDTHYRNLFETNTSSGSTNKQRRQQWEADMFGGAYSTSNSGSSCCEPFDRPKYGCLNVTGDIRGVGVARSNYGEFFMILHQHVRHRATFFEKDTGSFVASKTLATNEFYGHILMSYNDNELKAVLNVCASRIRGAPSKCSTYKEVQIHGPVCLAKDVQALSIPGRERDASKDMKQRVEVFQKITKCNILWQEDLLNADD